MKKKPIELKMILLGESGVGKTSIIKRYLNDFFDKNESSTLSMSYVGKTVEINNQKIILNIWDTIGQEKYRSISKLFLNETKIVILVYSITSKTSFNELEYWYNLYKEVLGEETILGIAGNKVDLYLDQEISDDEGKQYADKCGAIFALLSAKENKNTIYSLIDELVKAYINKINKKNDDNKNDNKEKDEQNNTIKLDEKKHDNDGNGTSSGEGCCGGKKKNKKKTTKDDKGFINSIVLGDLAVGKTSLINRFEGKEFNSDEEHTEKTNEIIINYNNTKLKLYDTNDEQKKSKEIFELINKSRIIFLVYDIKDKETLNNVSLWIEDIKKYKQLNEIKESYLLYIIANKKDDKEEEGITNENDKKKEYEEDGKKLANDNKGIFKITSAKDNIGLDNIIGEAIENYLKLP